MDCQVKELKMMRWIEELLRRSLWVAPLALALVAVPALPVRAGDDQGAQTWVGSDDEQNDSDSPADDDVQEQDEGQGDDAQGEKIESHGAWLGVGLGLTDNGRGVAVEQVFDGSPAEQAGLREGDVIVSFDGTPTPDASALSRAVRERQPGEKVSLRVLRDGRERTVDVTLAARETRKTIIRIPDIQKGLGDAGKVLSRSLSGLHEMGAPRAWMGVAMTELTPELRRHFGTSEERGVLIAQVRSGSPAERAGLRVGDVVTSVGDHDIDTPSDVADAIRSNESGDRVDVAYVRDGASRTTSVTLAARPGGGSDAGAAGNRRDRVFVVPGPQAGRQAEDLRQRMDALQQELDDLGRRLDALMGRMKSRGAAPKAPADDDSEPR